MSKINFTNKPQRKYYSYLSDGHIFDITSTKPAQMADGGNYWFCYFETQPYYRIGGTANTAYSVYPIYLKTGDTDDSYKRVTANDFYDGKAGTDGNYYYKTESAYTRISPSSSTTYCNLSGTVVYPWPNSVTELPQVVHNEENIYFDTLIKKGDSYGNSKFTPMDVTAGSGTTTYGNILEAKVKDSININKFAASASALPRYLMTPITSIGYTLTAQDFWLFGKVFIDILGNKLKKEADDIVFANKDIKNMLSFKNVEVTSTVTGTTTAPSGTITIVPKAN